MSENPVNEENIPAEFNFPHKWDACPNCGNTERVLNKIADEEKAAKKMAKDIPVGLQFGGIAIADPRTPPMRVPTVIPLFDICTQCGTLYCISIDKQIVQTQIQLPGQSGPGRNPFQGRGPFNNPRVS